MSLLMKTFRPGQISLDWEFQDPDTGIKFVSNSRASLVKTILQYRVNNQLPPIENLEMVLDNYLCNLPVNSGKCRPLPMLKRGVMGYVKGGILLLKSMLYARFAEQSLADTRSDICVNCPHNVFPDKTYFLKWSDQVAEASIKSKKAKNHNKLGNCEICTCVLKAKVWLHPEDLEAEPEHLVKFPKECWVKKELEAKANS